MSHASGLEKSDEPYLSLGHLSKLSSVMHEYNDD